MSCYVVLAGETPNPLPDCPQAEQYQQPGREALPETLAAGWTRNRRCGRRGKVTVEMTIGPSAQRSRRWSLRDLTEERTADQLRPVAT